MSKVRIVIGRRNQNRKANEELAYKIKSRQIRPIPTDHDIFIGRGSITRNCLL